MHKTSGGYRIGVWAGQAYKRAPKKYLFK